MIEDRLRLTSRHWTDYELVDSGGGRKLERFGPRCLIRPEARATWGATSPAKTWSEADAVFEPERGWRSDTPLEARWTMEYRDLRFWVQPAPSGHVGVFPEQAAHWDWMAALIEGTQRPVRVLNLFGYTGLATLAAVSAGAELVHVDASRKAVAWARENAKLSALENRPIRWIVDDALKFVRRERRRASRYDGFIVDPPPYGRGPRGEVWRIEKSLPVLLGECRALLSESPLFAVVTAYATRNDPKWLEHVVESALAGGEGTVVSGELAIVERSAGRVLPTAIFARWTCA